MKHLEACLKNITDAQIRRAEILLMDLGDYVEGDDETEYPAYKAAGQIIVAIGKDRGVKFQSTDPDYYWSLEDEEDD